MKLKYSDISTLTENTHINFKEYQEEKHGRKLNIQVDDAVVQQIVPPNTKIGIELLELMYGKDRYIEEYMALSSVNYYRIVARKQTQDGKSCDFIIGLNECFMNCGLQELEIIPDNTQPIQLNPNSILGDFGKYSVGQGFKNLKQFTPMGD